MTSETQFKMGSSLEEALPKDAIHVGTFTAISKEMLLRGMWVSVVELQKDNVWLVEQSGSKNAIGIVDPFYEEEDIFEGELFTVLCIPNVIKQVRHEWTHPSMPTMGRGAEGADTVELTPQQKTFFERMKLYGFTDYKTAAQFCYDYIEDGEQRIAPDGIVLSRPKPPNKYHKEDFVIEKDGVYKTYKTYDWDAIYKAQWDSDEHYKEWLKYINWEDFWSEFRYAERLYIGFSEYDEVCCPGEEYEYINWGCPFLGGPTDDDLS